MADFSIEAAALAVRHMLVLQAYEQEQRAKDKLEDANNNDIIKALKAAKIEYTTQNMIDFIRGNQLRFATGMHLNIDNDSTPKTFTGWWVLGKQPAGANDILLKEAGGIAKEFFKALGPQPDLGTFGDVMSALKDVKEGKEILSGETASGIYDRWNAGWEAGTWTAFLGSGTEFTTVSDAKHFVLGGPIKMEIGAGGETITGHTQIHSNRDHFWNLMTQAEREEAQSGSSCMKYTESLATTDGSGQRNYVVDIS